MYLIVCRSAMEKLGIFHGILILLALSSIMASTVLSITHQLNSKTTVLDVSAAISKTQSLFSLEMENVFPSEHRARRRDSAALSFQLHTRWAVHGASEKDYKSLTMARLARDSSRVEAILTRVSLGVEKPDRTPWEGGIGEEKLKGSVISGSSQGSGEYFCGVGIGNPVTEAYMVLDTGSDVSWVQCAPCADCYPQVNPIFDPALSSSFNPLTCEAPQCQSLEVSGCRNGTCLYEVSYGDGSYTVGEFATETFTFSDSAAVRDVAVGCGRNNAGLFIASSGLIGLGGGELSFPSQIDASAFSYCLVDRDSDSVSTLDFNSSTPPGAVTAPLLLNTRLGTFYYVDLTGIRVSGDLLPIPASTFRIGENGDGGVILDSGTAVTRLQAEAYRSMRDAFRNGTGQLRLSEGVALFDTCYDLSSMRSVEVPTVSFQFSNGKELQLPARNYMVPVDSSGTFCLAFAPTSASPSLGIIGNVQQQGTRVSYDLANSLIGFCPSNC